MTAFSPHGVRIFLTGVLLLVGSPAARAATFNETTGRLTLDPGSFAVTFDSWESLPAELHPTFLDEQDQVLGETDVAPMFDLDPNGLEGAGALTLGGRWAKVQLVLSELGPQFNGRRVEIRFWQRPQGTRLRTVIVWDQVDPLDPERSVMFGVFPFQPTGRATDDGWEEWTSGPVDFAVAGTIPPAVIELEDVQKNRRDHQYIELDTSLRVSLDALEILDLGPAATIDASCTSLTEADDCGPAGGCMLGRCVDAALRYGPMLQDVTLRNDYLDRRVFDFRAFEGGRMPQALMNVLEAEADVARAATSPRDFWPRLSRGVGALRDGHASEPMVVGNAGWSLTNLGVCVEQGEADLLPEPGPAPLVFSVSGSNPVADQLAVGDVLVAIDDLPPWEWDELLGSRARHGADPRSYEATAAPALIRRAQFSGSTMTFARCPRIGPNPAPCAATELETVEIDLGQLMADTIWAGENPLWRDDNADCDHRFLRAVDHPDVQRYSFAGYADDGPVRTLIINGLPSPWGSGADWMDTVEEALSPPPDYLILDQRTGSGGSVETTDFIMGLMVTEADFDRAEILPIFERPLDDALWSRLETCGSLYGGECGSYWRWSLHEVSGVSSALRGVAGSTRIAVLNAVDVSGNDFTTKLFTYRSAPTRIFGAGATFGAFGPIISIPAHWDEFYGGSMQFWDAIFVQYPDDPVQEFATGIGIPPDAVVYQRQSDALQGIDTVMEAARAWLLEE